MTLTQADIDLICRPADTNGRRYVDQPGATIYQDLGRGVWLDNGQPLLQGQMAYLLELASKARANGHTEAQNSRSNGHYGARGGDTAQEPETADTGQDSALSEADSMLFSVAVSRTYRNKTGYKAGGFKLNNSFKNEQLTGAEFVEAVIKAGWPYTMVHSKRSPEETGAAARGVLTPKHNENFISSQLLTADDDTGAAGVIDFWLGDPFFSRYGWLFVESVNSKSGAEKGHPTILFDEPITDPALFKECLQAFCSAYPRVDWLVNIDRTIYNAQGARVHDLGNVCPFLEFERHILTPYREEGAKKRAAIEAEQARRRLESGGKATSSDHLAAYIAGYGRWIFDKVAGKRRGDNRNIAIYWAGRAIAGIEATEWARPYLHELGDVAGRIIDAATANGYLADYAHNNPAEVVRIFERGRAAGGEALEQPEDSGPKFAEGAPAGAAPAADEQEAAKLPAVVVTGRHVVHVSADAYDALLAANNPPHLFRFGNTLARVFAPDGRAIIQPLDGALLRSMLERSARYVALRRGEDGPVEKPARAPDWLISDILSYPEWPGLPELRGVTAVPVAIPGGRIHATIGYDASTGLVYRPEDDVILGDISAERLDWAKRLLSEELLGEFPFADAPSRAHALALLLLPFVRPLVDGPTPLHVISAPKEGTGKGLLADVLTRLSAPDGAHLLTAGNDEDEWRKRITSSLVSGASHIQLDNLKNALVSGSLAAALTAWNWSDRILGKTQIITVPNRAVWLATGNNVMADSELARRCVWVRLDADVEKPWLRTGFRHADLRDWAAANRGDLITAALVLVTNWVAQGRPAGTAVMGSFEKWTRVVGGILDAAGIPGFMANAAQFYEAADPAAGMWAAFVERWWEKFQGGEVGTADLFPLADSQPEDNDHTIGEGLLDDLLGSGKSRARRTRLGMLLGQRKDQVIGDFKIVASSRRKNAQMYRLLQARADRVNLG